MSTLAQMPAAAKAMVHILIVDDEPVVRDPLRKWFTQKGYTATAAAGAREALELVRSDEFDIAVVDIRMPEMDGLELQVRLREVAPEMPVIIMTGCGVVTAAQALKHGAYEFITKPVKPDALSRLVGQALDHQRTTRELMRLRGSLQEVAPGTDLIASSPAMRKVVELIETVAPTDAPVLITGESGTGKEVVAQAIHAAGPRRDGPMVTTHCGALAETALEGELFGCEKDASTSAPCRKRGKFEEAGGGTVFLDEVSAIGVKTQKDLLRMFQAREIVRVGGDRPVKVDVRCIAATTKNLEELVKAGAFRPALYNWLQLFCIELPPLRAHREDIPLLANHFLKKFAKATSRPAPTISPEAMELLLRHDWPGNARELENAVERALVVNRGGDLQPADFPFQYQAEEIPSGKALHDVERAHIERILDEAQHNLSRAAKILAIDRSTLYNKLQRYRLHGGAAGPAIDPDIPSSSLRCSASRSRD